jgi:hypothetical protein
MKTVRTVDSKPHFGANGQNDVELVRQVVWQRVRKEIWNELSVNDYGFDQFVTFEDGSYRFIFGNLRSESSAEVVPAVLRVVQEAEGRKDLAPLEWINRSELQLAGSM